MTAKQFQKETRFTRTVLESRDRLARAPAGHVALLSEGVESRITGLSHRSGSITTYYCLQAALRRDPRESARSSRRQRCTHTQHAVEARSK